MKRLRYYATGQHPRILTLQTVTLIRVCPLLAWVKIHCVVSSFYTATTMDPSLLHPTTHLAEARGGQAPWWSTLLMQSANKTITMQGFKWCRKKHTMPLCYVFMHPQFLNDIRLGFMSRYCLLAKKSLWLNGILGCSLCEINIVLYCRGFDFYWSCCLQHFIRIWLFSCYAG